MRVALALPLSASAGSMAEPLKALQSQLAMVEHSVKLAGKVTPGVYETVKKMKNMVEGIIEPAIKEAHIGDQELINVVYKEIEACDEVYTQYLDQTIERGWEILNKTEKNIVTCTGDVQKLKASFAKCLDDRDLIIQHNNTVCCQEYAMCPHEGDCEVVKLDQAYVGCDYKTRSHEECWAHAQTLISSLKGYFEEQDTRFERLRSQCTEFNAATKAKIAECAYLQEAVNSKVQEANELVEEFREQSQAFSDKSKDQCKTYMMCRKTKEAQYVQVAGPCEKGDYAAGDGCVMNREQDRKNEWDATQLIKCMLEHYCQGGKFDEELLEKCKLSIETCHLEINYPKVQAAQPCTIKECKEVSGCDECMDRPYYQYMTPCYAGPAAEGCTSVEKPECPGWC